MSWARTAPPCSAKSATSRLPAGSIPAPVCLLSGEPTQAARRPTHKSTQAVVPHLLRPEGAVLPPSPTEMIGQFDGANSGLPLASFTSLAQTFWIAVTVLSGIGT